MAEAHSIMLRDRDSRNARTSGGATPAIDMVGSPAEGSPNVEEKSGALITEHPLSKHKYYVL